MNLELDNYSGFAIKTSQVYNGFMNEVWQKICLILKQQLSLNAYRVWIEGLEASVNIGAETIINLQAKSEFVAKKLEADFCHLIKNAAEQIGLDTIKITINVENHSQQATDYTPIIEKNIPLPLSSVDLERVQVQYTNYQESLPESKAFLASSTQLYLPIESPELSTFEARIANHKYKFENFVVGKCNELAFAAAKNIVDYDDAADMLFLSSGTGLGKTHLAQALGHCVYAHAKPKYNKVVYLTAEEYASRFVISLKQRNLEQFKDSFKSVDLLILEDVHFLRDKEKMQEELLSTIRSLQNRGAKVVLTSSFAPNELKGVDSQLVSRFCSGFVAGINKPDFETRINIVLEKAKFAKLKVPEKIAQIIAKQISSDIRQLESCLNTIVLKSRLSGKALTEDMAYEAIEQFSTLNPSLDIDAIIELVCKSYEINKKQIGSKSRRQDFVLARNVAFYLARKHTELSLASIGDYFNRKHCTVIKGIESIEKELLRQTPLSYQLQHTLKFIEKQRV